MIGGARGCPDFIVPIPEQGGSASVRDLSPMVRALPATTRGNLKPLARGGVPHQDVAAGETSFKDKARTAALAKLAIGRVAARQVKGAASVFVDSGTTTLEAARHLVLRSNLTLFTNSVPLLRLRGIVRCQLVCIGGAIRQPSRALVGTVATGGLGRMKFDYCLIGASGLDRAAGASTTEVQEAAIKREAIRRSRHVLLLADASKWNHPAAIRFAEWGDFDGWVTDAKVDPETRRRLRRADVALLPAACRPASSVRQPQSR